MFPNHSTVAVLCGVFPMELPLSLSLLILLEFRGVPQFTRHDHHFPHFSDEDPQVFGNLNPTILVSPLVWPQRNLKETRSDFVELCLLITHRRRRKSPEKMSSGGIRMKSSASPPTPPIRRSKVPIEEWLSGQLLDFLENLVLLVCTERLSCSGTILIRTPTTRLQRICLRRLHLLMMSCLIQRIGVSMIQLVLRLDSYKS